MNKIQYKLLLFFMVLSSFMNGQNYKALREGSNCLENDYVSIYATPEDVEMFLNYIVNCDSIKYLRIVGYKAGEHWDRLFEGISNLKSIKGVELYYNEGLKKVPSKIKQSKNLRVIKVVGNRKLDYTDLCKKLKKLPDLESLSLVDNKLTEVPKALGELENIKKLKITGNEGLNYSELVDVIKTNENLSELSIPLNSLSEIPENIDELKHLKVLDIRKNYIASFPKSIGSLDSLGTLKAEGNLILDFKEESEKLKTLNIKYLSIDVPDKQDDIKAVKQIFKDAEIVTTGMPEEKKIEKQKKDIVEVKGSLFDKESYETCYEAVKQYNFLFNKRRLFTEYDSTTFFDRLTDESYSYNEKVVSENQFIGVELTFHSKPKLFKKKVACPYYKVKRGEIAFSLCSKGNYYPELNAFNGMLWVYVGGETKKEFYKNYVKDKRWKDVFIEYDPLEKNFFVVLKGEELVRLQAFPRYANLSSNIDDAKRQYDSKFRMYQQRLNLRAKRFDKAMMEEKEKYLKNVVKWDEIRWKNLTQYMCDYEKGLSKDAWMEYKDFLISKRHKPADSLEFNLKNLEKSLKLKYYNTQKKKSREVQKNHIYKSTVRVNVSFSDSLGNVQQIKNLLIIDTLRKEVSWFDYEQAKTIEFISKKEMIAVLVNNVGDYQVLPIQKLYLSDERGLKKNKPVEIIVPNEYKASTIKGFWQQINSL